MSLSERMMALEPPKNDDWVYNTAMEKVFAEMEKRNRYLEENSGEGMSSHR